MVMTIIATQAREGIETTREQAERAYDVIQREMGRAPGAGGPPKPAGQGSTPCRPATMTVVVTSYPAETLFQEALKGWVL